MLFVASTARGGACHQCGANCSIEMISNVSNTFRYSKRKRERKGENSRIPWRTWIKNDQTLITFHPTISVSYPLFSIVSYVESLRLRQWTAKDQAASQRAPWRWRSSRSLEPRWCSPWGWNHGPRSQSSQTYGRRWMLATTLTHLES